MNEAKDCQHERLVKVHAPGEQVEGYDVYRCEECRRTIGVRPRWWRTPHRPAYMVQVKGR